MGFDIDGVKFLLAAKASGVCFTKVATIGRQELQLSFDSLNKNLRFFNINKTDIEIKHLLLEGNGHAESFLRMLGAEEICSIDASTYEGATFIHDMNLQIPSELKNTFTVVIDGGSLEHIFDFPRAIKNCIEMVQVGGHFLGITPVNNFMGHGFYQFSPELYFRVFTKDNGFSIERVILFESTPKAKWYKVNDPEKVQKRITLSNSQPTYLLIQAKKIDCVPIFSSVPQQDHYVRLWNKGADSSNSTPLENTTDSKNKLRRKVFTAIRQLTPEPLKKTYRTIRAATRTVIEPSPQLHQSRFDSESFEQIDMSDLLRGRIR